jgi:hypothetical protein
LIKERNKERAQKSRDRKMQYTKSLEQKVNILEKQVKYLTLEVDKYKKILAKHELKHDDKDVNIKEEQNILEGILTYLQSSKSVNKFSEEYNQIRSKEGCAGENRMKTLDKAFNVIFDFLIPDTFLMSFYLMQQEGDKDQYIDSKRLKKMKSLSKYQMQEAYSNKEANDNDIYWTELQTTDEQMEIIDRNHHMLLEGKNKLRAIMAKLKSIREEIKKNAIVLDEYPKTVIP